MSAGSNQPADTRIETIRDWLALDPRADVESGVVDEFLVAVSALAAVADELAEAKQDRTEWQRHFYAERDRLAELREALEQLKAAVREYLSGGGGGPITPEWYIACNERTGGKNYPRKAALARAALSRGAE